MKKIAVLLVVFATAAFTVQAQPRQGKANNGGERGSRVCLYYSDNGCRIPNLSQEQQDEIKKLRLEKTKEQTTLRNQIAEKRARLNTLQAADKADINAINKTIDEIASLQAQRMKANANFRVKVRSLLTDEQKVAFDNRGNHHRQFNFGRGNGNMKMRMYKFDDLSSLNELDVDEMKANLKQLGELRSCNFDFDSFGFNNSFEFEVED